MKLKFRKLITSVALLIILLSSGMTVSQSSIHASNLEPVTITSTHLSHKQAKKQKQSQIMRAVKKALKHRKNKRNWFRDGLSHRELRARGWITRHESGNHWKVLSYGHVCVGYFQLNPHYLGYKHGHVNLGRKHQVKTADSYAKHRYGSWIHAKHFWQSHHWY